MGPCECGRDHELVTKKVVVEYNAFANFERYMEETDSPGAGR